jgi:PhnB protein
MAKVKTGLAEGFTALTPYLRIRGASDAIAFYVSVFGAIETMRMHMGERIGHAELTIGGAKLALADEFPEMGVVGPKTLQGSSIALMHYCDDVDAVVAKAVAAGAKVLREVADQFYGDRVGTVEDPFGHVWMIHTHIEDVKPAELQKRLDAMMSGGAAPQPVASAAMPAKASKAAVRPQAKKIKSKGKGQ